MKFPSPIKHSRMQHRRHIKDGPQPITSHTCIQSLAILRVDSVHKRALYCERQRLQSIILQLGEPKVHDVYAPTKVVYGNLSQRIKHLGPAPAVTQRGRTLCHCSSGLSRPLPLPPWARKLMCWLPSSMPCHCYLSLLAPIMLACTWYCSMLAQAGPTTARSLIDKSGLSQ